MNKRDGKKSNKHVNVLIIASVIILITLVILSVFFLLSPKIKTSLSPSLQETSFSAQSGGAACGNGIIENGSVVFSSYNQKDPSKYSSKKVFIISDDNWKDVLPLIPVTTWTGNETWCKKGYGTSSDTCVYPTLIFHHVNPITQIKFDTLTRGIDGSLIVTEGDGTNLTSQSWSYPCATPGPTGSLSIWRPSFNKSTINVGETSQMKIVLVNCNSLNSSIIKSIQVHFTQLDDFITSYNQTFSGADSIILPGQAKNITVNLTFVAPLPEAVDADSLIHFMQQYSANNVTIIGNTTAEFDGLLVIPEPFGAGVSSDNIERISPENYFSFWNDFDTVVYSQDDYETAILSATYASLHDLPLIIKGGNLDIQSVYSGKNLICIGNVSGLPCNVNLDLEQLRQKYYDETRTDKIIFINPNDTSTIVRDDLRPKKTANTIYELYGKTSLSAAILASAKKELIVSTKSAKSTDDNTQLKLWIRNIYNSTKPPIYITIMASPLDIPFRGNIPSLNYLIRSTVKALDQNYYGDNNNNFMLDFNIGRITGLTTTDISSYLARDLFYNETRRSNDTVFLAKAFSQLENECGNWTIIFKNAGYNSSCFKTSWPSSVYSNKLLVNYLDHGGAHSGGVNYKDLPELDNSLDFEFACSTCYALGQEDGSYCANSIRSGAIMYMGAVDTDYLGSQYIHMGTMNDIFMNNNDIGTSFKSGYFTQYNLTGGNAPLATLLGDPTFKVNPPHKLNSPLQY